MQIIPGAEASTDDFWYDLAVGGYIKPEMFLKNQSDIDDVEKAISILNDFYNSCVQQIDGFLR